MILFWLLPSVFASIQLFFYGTYLVHEKDGVIKNSNLPDWLVTLTSYNFGHHQNHHKYPKLPWFDLKRDKDELLDELSRSNFDKESFYVFFHTEAWENASKDNPEKVMIIDGYKIIAP